METYRDATILHVVSTKRDMHYAGQVVKAWVEARYSSPYGLKSATDFPASTTYAVIAGKRYAHDHKNVLRLEHALGWPMGTVGLLSLHDFDGMERVGCPSSLIRQAKSLVPQREERRTRNRGA